MTRTGPDGGDAVFVALVSTHEMWLCGRQFLTITYGVVPADENREN